MREERDQFQEDLPVLIKDVGQDRLRQGSVGAGGVPIPPGSVRHPDLLAVTPDQHHAEVHVLSGGDHTGQISDFQHGSRSTALAHHHINLADVFPNQHHNQFHAAAHAQAGGDDLMDATNPVTQVFGDVPSPGVSTHASHRDHRHGMPANPNPGIASLTAEIDVINTLVETQLIGLPIPANRLVVGSTFLMILHGVLTKDTIPTLTFRVRIGTTTLTGNIACQVVHTPASGNNGVVIEALVTIRSVGVAGTVIGEIVVREILAGGALTGASSTSVNLVPVAIDTTATNQIEVTAQWSAADPSDSLKIVVASIVLQH